MITITNSKVAGFAPVWASYRGFSLLFDNPGKNLAATPGGLLKIDCAVASDPNLLLYKAFDKSLRKIGHDVLTKTYLFCPLPPQSYHVTVWDGISDGKVSSVISYHRDEVKRCLQDLPNSLHRFPMALAFILKSSLPGGAYGTMGFKFKKLKLWGNQTLVARLEPVSEDPPKDWLADIVEARRSLTNQLDDQLHVPDARSRKKKSHGFSPHISLGYFANQGGGPWRCHRWRSGRSSS